ncbi:HTH domain-containing protein, partial [Staphylococcus hominis]
MSQETLSKKLNVSRQTI